MNVWCITSPTISLDPIPFMIVRKLSQIKSKRLIIYIHKHEIKNHENKTMRKGREKQSSNSSVLFILSIIIS
jgi:hypothetical protein